MAMPWLQQSAPLGLTRPELTPNKSSCQIKAPEAHFAFLESPMPFGLDLLTSMGLLPPSYDAHMQSSRYQKHGQLYKPLEFTDEHARLLEQRQSELMETHRKLAECVDTSARVSAQTTTTTRI